MQKKQETIGLVWFTNDLRIHDNEVLKTAAERHKKLIAIYCINPNMLQKTHFGFEKIGIHRANFLLQTLHDLKGNLTAKNITLLTYLNSAEDSISNICEQFSIDTIYVQNEWTSEELKTLAKVKNKIPNGVTVHKVYNQFLYHPDDIQIEPKNIPEVFSVFRKKLEKTISVREEVFFEKLDAENLLQVPNEIPTLQELGFHDYQQNTKTAFPFKGGETNALERLNNYFFETKKLGFYKKTRNGLVGKDYSSKFSAWLANGSISARTIYWNVKKFEKEVYKNQSTYWLIFELIWRDYFKYISFKHGNDVFKIDGILHKKYDWKRDEKLVKQWINGETNDDFVNANMIELKETGWMSNRGRQNVASYFAKELFLDWRIGAAYFEKMLLDYDVHSNYGNWMYVSGVGNDPRDRKFNTQLQAERYDGNHAFRKLWLQKTLF